MPSIRMRLLKPFLRFVGNRTHKLNHVDLRASFEKDAKGFCKLPENLVTENVLIGKCSAQWISTESLAKDSVILYLHGGAFVFGSVNSHRATVAQITKLSGAKALMPEFRLAPEHPFPAALEDCLAAYRYILNQRIEPKKIVIAGDSSGGGLVLSLMMKARDEGLPMPAGGVLISPWLDLTQSGETMLSNAPFDPMIKKYKMDEWTGMYLGKGNDQKNPQISPLFGSMRGLPPLLCLVSSDECLFSDSIRLKDAALKVGVPLELIVGEKYLHVWPLFSSVLPESKAALVKIGEFIGRHTR